MAFILYFLMLDRIYFSEYVLKRKLKNDKYVIPLSYSSEAYPTTYDIRFLRVISQDQAHSIANDVQAASEFSVFVQVEEGCGCARPFCVCSHRILYREASVASGNTEDGGGGSSAFCHRSRKQDTIAVQGHRD